MEQGSSLMPFAAEPLAFVLVTLAPFGGRGIVLHIKPLCQAWWLQLWFIKLSFIACISRCFPSHELRRPLAVWCGGGGYGRRGHSSLSPKKFSLHYLQESYGCPAMQSHAGDSLGHPPYPTTHSCTNAHTHTPTHVSHFPCHGFQLISRHTWKSDRPGSFWQKGKTFLVYFNYDWINELGWNKIERKKMEKESSRQKERKECLIKRKAFRPPGRIWSLIHDGWSSDNTAC